MLKQHVASVLISLTMVLEPVAGRLPQYTFCNSEVATPFLTLHACLLLGEQECGGIRKTAQIFSFPPEIKLGTSWL